MKNNYFSGAYHNDNDLKTTLKFINIFKSDLKKALIKEFNLFEVETPKICKFKENITTRLINFDNKQLEQVFQVIIYPCEYLNNLWKRLGVESTSGLISVYCQYDRDISLNNTKFIYKNVIDFRFTIDKLETNNFNQLSYKFMSQILNLIKDIVLKIKSQIDVSINEQIFEIDPKIVSMNNFFKTYQSLKIDDFIQENVYDYKSILFTNINFLNSIHLELFSDFDDSKKNCQWLWFNKYSDQIVNLMKLALSNDDKSDLNYVHITINLEQLILVLLKKSNIAEVLPGAWNEDFKKEVEKKKVEII